MTGKIDQQYAAGWSVRARLFDGLIDMVQAGQAWCGFARSTFCNFVIRLLEGGTHRVDIAADSGIEARVVEFVAIVAWDAY
jgi:hypothetical protein